MCTMDKLKVVQVVFGNDNKSYSIHSSCKKYDYFTTEDFKCGDKAVVHVVSHTDGGYKVVEVVGVKSVKDSNNATKWVICKVDVAKFESESEQRLQLLRNVEEVRRIHRQLEQKANEARRRLEVAELLKGDKEAEELLARLVELNRSI